jgi:nucleotide-binding universal stress UspA family protein
MAFDESRRGRRTKFLVVVDSTPECRVALRFASHRAKRVGGGVVMLHVVDQPEGSAEAAHWISVAEQLKAEQREAAEALLQELAAEVMKDSGIMPEFVIREGRPQDELVALVADEPHVLCLVLGAAPGSQGPGPLVTQLAGRLSGSFQIPILVIPGTLSDEMIAELT